MWMGAADTHLNALDRVQQRACKMIGDGVKLDTLTHRRKVGALTYLYKLKAGAQNSIDVAA